MNLSSHKAKTISVVAFVLSLLFFIFTLIFGAITEVLAIYLLSWHVLAGLLVWLVLLLQFYQRTLAEQEKLDMSQLSKSSQEETIFSGDSNRMAMLAVAQKRLVFLEKWVIPISGVLIAIYQIVMGLVLLNGKVLDETQRLDVWSDPQHLLLGAALMGAISFISFLFSRYATGMSEETEWKPLRAGGSYLLAAAILGFALAVSMGFAQYKHTLGLTLLSFIIPVLIIVLGAETLLNTILDIYRPRVAGQYSRTAFDSRILGLINEPGGFLHTEKAILPLILFALLILYLMSSFVVIDAGHAGVIERFGVLNRNIDPGLRMKWPWPIEKAYEYPTDQIQQVTIGYKAGEEQENKKAFLWGEKHYEEEYDLLVAVQTDSPEQNVGEVPVSIVQANVPILYRISDIEKFIYNHKDSRQLLESICYRELTRYAASAKIEMDDSRALHELGSQKSLLGAGRREAVSELQRRIQNELDQADLGIEIVHLGLQGVHPPAQVAKAYEEVVASVQ
ncbi:MAG: SPFH domain-containing protein, partial [Planctomycetota bacterium]